MPYRLQVTAAPGPEVRRCALEQLSEASAGLRSAAADGAGTDAAEAVHSARKGVKKTRSLLRLARPALPAKQYRRANDALRQAAGGLSATRDADVLLQVVTGLHEAAPGQLPAAAFERLRAALAVLHPAIAADAGTGPADDPLVVGAERLDAVAARVDDWDLGDIGWDVLLDGLQRQYDRGRDALLAILDGADGPEARHDWRKRVKDHWYHQRLLTEAWEPVLTASAEEAHVLSELLGDDHDLWVLRTAVTDGRVDAAVDEAAVLALVDDRRAELLAAALPLGRRVYAETPKALRLRLATYVG